jgi:hypothetical protein
MDGQQQQQQQQMKWLLHGSILSSSSSVAMQQCVPGFCWVMWQCGGVVYAPVACGTSARPTRRPQHLAKHETLVNRLLLAQIRAACHLSQQLLFEPQNFPKRAPGAAAAAANSEAALPAQVSRYSL